MKCHHVLQEMSVTSQAALRGWTALRIKRHLKGCPSCRAGLAAIQALDVQVRNWRTDTPPHELRDRIAAQLATEIIIDLPVTSRSPFHEFLDKLKEDQTMQRHLSLATAALAAVICFAINLHGKPADAAIAAMRHMQVAVGAVRNAHVITWVTDYKTDNDTVTHHSSTLQKSEEEWYQDGRTRKEGLWGSRLIVGAVGYTTDSAGRKLLIPGTYYRYDAKAKKVISMQEEGAQWSKFTVEAFTGDLTTRPGTKITTIGVMHINDQPVREILITLPTHPGVSDSDSRTLCWVNETTHLPMRIESQTLRMGRWVTNTKFEFEFNKTLPSSLFDPKTLHHENWSLDRTVQTTIPNSLVPVAQIQALHLAPVYNAHVTTSVIEYVSSQDRHIHKFGGLQKIEEKWYQNGLWHSEGMGGSQTEKVRGAKGLIEQPQFTLEALVGDDHLGLRQSQISDLGTHQIHGRLAHEYRVERIGVSNSPHWDCFLDAITNLPIQIQDQNLRDGHWVTTIQQNFEFNQPIPKAVFDPKRS